MHDVQTPHERLETALCSGNVIALPANTPPISHGEHLAVPTPPIAESRPPQDKSFSQEKPLSFEQVRERVQSDDTGKWDIVLPKSQVVMQEGKLLFPDAKAYECQDGLDLSPWAVSQICQRLNIPTSYFRRCPVHLKDTQFNWWNGKSKTDLSGMTPGAGNNGSSHNGSPDDGSSEDSIWDGNHPSDQSVDSANEPEGYSSGWSNSTSNGHQFKNGIYAGTDKSEYWLLRARGETLRAVLTDRYTPLDNRILLDALSRSLPPHLQVQWLALDDEAFHLRIIDPTLAKDVLADDRVMAGIHIANSEVGRRSVTVDAVVFRLVCSNGLIKLVKGKSILSQRHVAVSPYHFSALLRQGLSQALSASSQFMEQLTWSTTQRLKDVEAEMKSLMQHHHLSQGFVEQVKTSLKNERSDQQETVFGLTNALTAAAQSLDAEQRYDVEVLAGQILERRSMQSLKGASRSRPVNVPLALRNGSHDNSGVAEAIEAAEVLFEAEAVNGRPDSEAV